MSGLSAPPIFLVLDWVMKYLPRKFRESQSDWFGKRGISWHIAVAIKCNSGEMEMMTFVHVFESATAQDSSSVSAILDDVFIQLKTIMPELQWITCKTFDNCSYATLERHAWNTSAGQRQSRRTLYEKSVRAPIPLNFKLFFN